MTDVLAAAPTWEPGDRLSTRRGVHIARAMVDVIDEDTLKEANFYRLLLTPSSFVAGFATHRCAFCLTSWRTFWTDTDRDCWSCGRMASTSEQIDEARRRLAAIQ